MHVSENISLFFCTPLNYRLTVLMQFEAYIVCLWLQGKITSSWEGLVMISRGSALTNSLVQMRKKEA